MKKLFIGLSAILALTSFKKAVITSVTVLSVYEVKSQSPYSGLLSAAQSTCDGSVEFFQFLSPTSVPCNRWGPLKSTKDRTWLRNRTISMDSLLLITSPTPTANFMWMESNRTISISPISAFPLTFQQVTTALTYVPGSGSMVNADWNSVSGPSEIFNKPTIPAQYNPSVGAGLSLSGSYPNHTITNTGVVSESDPQFDTKLAGKSTSDLAEGSNLYYTTARFNTALSSKTTDDLAEGSNLYYTSTRFDNAFGGKTTTNLSEGTNLYYTAARFNTSFSGKTTADLAEGSNLYYTVARFNTAFGSKSTTDLAEGTNLYYTSGRFNTSFATKTTDDLNEGIFNKYYTTVRFLADLSFTTTDQLTEGNNRFYYTAARTRTCVSAGTGISYDNSTGVITNTAAYIAPTTHTASRAINGSTFSVSSNITWVAYTIRINCSATIGGAASGTVSLQYSTNGGSTWVDVSQVENSNTVTLAVTLNSNTTQTGVLAGCIPGNAIVRMNQGSSGSTTITYVRGQETY